MNYFKTNDIFLPHQGPYAAPIHVVIGMGGQSLSHNLEPKPPKYLGKKKQHTIVHSIFIFHFYLFLFIFMILYLFLFIVSYLFLTFYWKQNI